MIAGYESPEALVPQRPQSAYGTPTRVRQSPSVEEVSDDVAVRRFGHVMR